MVHDVASKSTSICRIVTIVVTDRVIDGSGDASSDGIVSSL